MVGQLFHYHPSGFSQKVSKGCVKGEEGGAPCAPVDLVSMGV